MEYRCNLAVIYAQQKQYDKAKQSLEMAIRTHPSYATAHENLGDIYTRMASQAYDKALQIDSSNTSAQTKLSMIRDLMGTRSGAGGKPTVVASAPAAPVAPAAPAPKPVEAKPAEPVKPAEPPKPEPPKAVEQPRPVEAARPAEPPRPEPKPQANNLASEVGRAIEGWAAAWSKKNVKGYLSHYARDFRTPGGESRAKWETERSQRINKPGTINVDFDALRVTADGADKATARFRQHYKSANLKTSSNKTLVMVRQDGKWLIQQERIGH